MKRRFAGFFLCLIGAALHAQTAPPDEGQRSAMIDRMRTAALSYTDKLQDFTCIQQMVRSADTSGSGKRFKLIETQKLELDYVAHKEHYKLLEVNGKPAASDKKVKKGYFKPGGKFGTALQRIFDPKAKAEFTWDREEPLAEKRMCIFRYNVPLATTTYVMQVNLQFIPLGQHGFVYADCETGAVMRFQMDTDQPIIREQGHDIRIGEQLDVNYGRLTMDAKEFLLPVEAKEIAIFDKALTKAEIQFGQYRKYDSNSSVTFEPPKL